MTPGTAALALTAFAPTVTGGSGVTVTPSTATLTLTTFAPTVTATENIVEPTVARGGGSMTLRKRKRGMPDDDMLRYARMLKEDQELIELMPIIVAVIAEHHVS